MDTSMTGTGLLPHADRDGVPSALSGRRHRSRNLLPVAHTHRNPPGHRRGRTGGGRWPLLSVPDPADGAYLADLLPGLMIVSLGLGAVFVGVGIAANAGVPAEEAGLAAALPNTSQQVGSALGLAIFAAIATSHSQHLLAANSPVPEALTSGFQRALLTGSIFLTAAALIAPRTGNAPGDDGHRAE